MFFQNETLTKKLQNLDILFLGGIFDNLEIVSKSSQSTWGQFGV